MGKTSTGYHFGKFLGRHWLLSGIVLLLAYVWISHLVASPGAPPSAAVRPVSQSSPQQQTYSAEDQRIIAKSAAKRAEIAKEEAERQQRCAAGILEVVAQARAAMKAGDPDKGLAIMNGCANAITDADAKAAHKEVLLAARAKAEKERKMAAEYAKRIEKADLARRKKEGVSIGMSMDDARKSQWGRPERINRSTNALGTHEQWVYPGYHNYLYFDNGVLTSIQN
jgi:hypothetical protein